MFHAVNVLFKSLNWKYLWSSSVPVFVVKDIPRTWRLPTFFASFKVFSLAAQDATLTVRRYCYWCDEFLIYFYLIWNNSYMKYTYDKENKMKIQVVTCTNMQSICARVHSQSGVYNTPTFSFNIISSEVRVTWQRSIEYSSIETSFPQHEDLIPDRNSA